MSGIKVEPAFDTSVETFVPFRSSPVYRRVQRRYHCQENVNGTKDFKQLTFKIHQPNENLVISECRLVLPLRMEALDKDNEPMCMAASRGESACNVAIAENPFSAFKVIDTVINGKGYTEEPRSYGNMLSACYSSVSEMGWQNNHSLKPIANTNRINSFPRTRRLVVHDQNNDATNNYVEMFGLQIHKSAFVAEQLNSGFLERSRQFQQGLLTGGLVWKDNISTLLNTALWSNESRGQGNIQIPYVEDLFMRFVFQTNQCVLDNLYGPSTKASRIIAQSLFEFLTPMNAQLYSSDLVESESFVVNWDMEFTDDPYLQIEWVQYQEMLPIYRLRGFRYQLVKSNEFPLLIPNNMDFVADHYVPARVSQECLAVPNKVYCWGELSETSARSAYCWGNMFRTTDLKNIQVRVNGHAHIISDPDSQGMVFKWWKRNTNSTNEFPVWNQRKMFVFTPTEVGLNQWLENDAVLSTLEISADVGLSRLQYLEYGLVDNKEYLDQIGYSKTHTNWNRELVRTEMGTPNTIQFHFSEVMERARYWPDIGDARISISQVSEIGHTVNHVAPFLTSEACTEVFAGYKFRNTDPTISAETMRIRGCDRTLVQYNNSIWFKLDTSNDTIVNNDFFFVPQSHLFQFSDDEAGRQGLRPLPWTYMHWDDAYNTHTFDASTPVNSAFIREGLPVCKAFGRDDLHTPLFNFNHQSHTNLGYKKCVPGPRAYRIKQATGGALGVNGVMVQDGLLEEGDDNYHGLDSGDGDMWVLMSQPNNTNPQWFMWHTLESGASDYSSMGDRGEFPPLCLGHMQFDSERGMHGTEAKRYDARSSQYEFHAPAQPDVSPHMKYELNVLLEYSNSQVLMSRTREVPIHVSNLVAR